MSPGLTHTPTLPHSHTSPPSPPRPLRGLGEELFPFGDLRAAEAGGGGAGVLLRAAGQALGQPRGALDADTSALRLLGEGAVVRDESGAGALARGEGAEVVENGVVRGAVAAGDPL